MPVAARRQQARPGETGLTLAQLIFEFAALIAAQSSARNVQTSYLGGRYFLNRCGPNNQFREKAAGKPMIEDATRQFKEIRNELEQLSTTALKMGHLKRIMANYVEAAGPSQIGLEELLENSLRFAADFGRFGRGEYHRGD